MDIDVRDSHGCACGVDTWFSWMAYEISTGDWSSDVCSSDLEKSNK